jgi:hypothetical protein
LKCGSYVTSMLVTYMNTFTPSELLAQIAQIQRMERGKLSSYSFPERARPAHPYHKLQCWEKGKNVTRYVRAEQVPLVEAALTGYAQFQELVEQYAQQIIAATREELAAVGVKKKPGRRPGSSWRRSKRSKS